MNPSIMALSVVPCACNLAMRSLAGFEKLHSSLAQLCTVSVQPHLQPICEPTRRTSTPGFSAAVSARAAPRGYPTTAKTSKLLRNFRIFSSDPHHFGAGVLHFDFTRHQAHQRPADQDQTADPDPGYQREDVGLDNGSRAIVGHAAEVQIHILVQSRTHAHFRGTLAAAFIQALFRSERGEQIGAAPGLYCGAMPAIVAVIAFLQIDHF